VHPLTGESRATQLCERFDFLVTLLAQLLIDRALCLGVAMRRGEAQPAWRDPAIRRGQDLITIPLGEQGMVEGVACASAACASPNVAGTRVIHFTVVSASCWRLSAF